MENDKKQVSRKKFLFWGVGISAIFAIPAFLKPGKKGESSDRVKMLTKDGRLIEIDVANIPEKRERINSKDIHSWIHKQKTSL